MHALGHSYRIAKQSHGLSAHALVLDVQDLRGLAFYRSFDFFIPLTDLSSMLFIPMSVLRILQTAR